MVGCACGAKLQVLTEEQKKVLQAFKNTNKPEGSKDIAEATGLDKKAVAGIIFNLRKQGLIDSPARCKYGITGDGVNALG